MSERPCQRKGPITRESILDQALSHLHMVDQWVRLLDWQRAAGYAAKAESLIELVEIAETGSCGYFAGGDPKDPNTKTLKQRLSWLCSHPPRRTRG